MSVYEIITTILSTIITLIAVVKLFFYITDRFSKRK